MADLVVSGRFKDGGRGPVDFDCWGLASEVFKRYGVSVPDYKISCDAIMEVDAQMNAERTSWARCEGEPPIPSLVVFADRGLCSHVGVYIGDGRFIHAYEKTGVSITPTNHIFWKSRVEGFYIPRWANAEYSVNQKSNTARPAGRT